jgi:hypothetical protein
MGMFRQLTRSLIISGLRTVRELMAISPFLETNRS